MPVGDDHVDPITAEETRVNEREQAAGERDDDGDDRDEAGAMRDVAGDLRDRAGVGRDRSGEERDRAAESRDRDARAVERLEGIGTTRAGFDRSAKARKDAALDRSRSSEDRRASADERMRAMADRTTASRDRAISMEDRSASAADRDVAAVDALTGAYLRGSGLHELQREMDRARRTGQPLGLAFVDVDHLKVVNDSWGHAAGDRVLRAVVEAMRDRLRSYDLVVRYGGDEFLCVLPGLDLDGSNRRLAGVNEVLSSRSESSTVTVGAAALLPDDTPHTLIARADADLYRQRAERGAS